MTIDRRISLQKLEVLSLVVQLGGVGRAAEQLHVAQPVVSAHLRSLEQRLGARLFYRDGRKLHLTEAGHEVHRWAEDLLMRTRELDRHLGGLSDGQRGTVFFGASMSVGSYRLPPVLSAFRASHPDAQLRLSISDTEHAVEDTRAGSLDFAVVVTDVEADLPGMDLEQLGSDEIVVVASPARSCADVLTIEQLRELPFIDAPSGIIRRAFVDRQLRRLGVHEREVVLELGHPEAMKRATRDDLGVALLFRSAVQDELTAGTLRELRIEGVDMSVPIQLASRKGKTFSALHRELIETIRAALSP